MGQTKSNEEVVKCEECGDKIPWARLKAIPDARLCVKCKAVLEKLEEPVLIEIDDYDPSELMDAIDQDGDD